MTEQMTHILVPVDFSDHSDTAISYATMLAQHFGGSIELLHVVEDPFVSGAWSAEAFTPNIPELLDQVIADARVRLDALQSAAASEGVALTTNVEKGRPAQAIVERARSGAFGLIVMGTHGRTGVSHLVLGSVAERVVRTAPCPVLTVRMTTPRASEVRTRTTVTVV
jgi:nucleotide-binding universal stress UspA family protein